MQNAVSQKLEPGSLAKVDEFRTGYACLPCGGAQREREMFANAFEKTLGAETSRVAWEIGKCRESISNLPKLSPQLEAAVAKAGLGKAVETFTARAAGGNKH